MPMEQYRKQREEIFFEYGAIQNFRCCPQNEAELYRIISMEHRLQKGLAAQNKKEAGCSGQIGGVESMPEKDSFYYLNAYQDGITPGQKNDDPA